MKKIPILFLCISSLQAAAQIDSLTAVAEITAFRTKLNEEFRNRNEPPLEAADFLKFESYNTRRSFQNFRIKK